MCGRSLAVSARFERIVIVGSTARRWSPGSRPRSPRVGRSSGPLQGARVDWLFVSLLLFLSIIPIIPTIFLPKGRLFARGAG